MTDNTPSPSAGLAGALAALPAYQGITYRGSQGDLPKTFSVDGLLPTSADPRIATENFTSPTVVAILVKTGRAIGPLSAFPAEQEVVLLPGTVLNTLATADLDGVPSRLVIVEEIADKKIDGLPDTLEQLTASLVAGITDSRSAGRAELTSPGKFADRVTA